MSKVVEYKKGSVIFFEGGKSSDIFLLKNGSVEISFNDVTTNKTVVNCISVGEVFGVRDTLTNIPRTSQAVAASDSTIIVFSIKEFEELLGSDNNLCMNTVVKIYLKLKNLHAKLYNKSKLNAKKIFNSEHGMFRVAKGFFNASSYMQCHDISKKFLELYPTSDYVPEINDFLKTSEKFISEISNINTSVFLTDTDELNIFLSSSFKKYEKTFPARQVIFSEFEEGTSVFLVLSGIVHSTKFISGRNFGISLTAPGEIFGLNGIVNQNLREVTASTTSEVKVLEIPLSDFWKFVLSNSKVALVVMRLLSRRINNDALVLKNIYISDLQIKLKDIFVALDEMGFCEKIKGNIRKVYLSSMDISAWTGEPLEVIEEELEYLEKHGVIVRSDDGWIIVNNIEMARRDIDTKKIINKTSYQKQGMEAPHKK